MTRTITKQDIYQIRSKVASLQGSYAPGALVFANIVLPEPCDRETLDYAYKLSMALGKTNCRVQISNILNFPFRGTATKNYEVMKDIPLGIPCIRVYPQNRPTQSPWKSIARICTSSFWRNLFTRSGNKSQVFS